VEGDAVSDDLVARLREYADYRATADDLSQCLFQTADRIEQQQKRNNELEAAIKTLKAAFRVNMLRANASHEEIDAVIRAALGEKKDG
jgi:cell division protein FtsB